MGEAGSGVPRSEKVVRGPEQREGFRNTRLGVKNRLPIDIVRRIIFSAQSQKVLMHALFTGGEDRPVVPEKDGVRLSVEERIVTLLGVAKVSVLLPGLIRTVPNRTVVKYSCSRTFSDPVLIP